MQIGHNKATQKEIQSMEQILFHKRIPVQLREKQRLIMFTPTHR
jgi:hypothetical protein